MVSPPTERMRELETLFAKIRNAGMMQLNYDMWDQHGSEHATPNQRAAMAADLEAATREQIAAKAALEALVARTRAEAPAEIAAWVDAHDAYLAAFLADCAARGEVDGTGAHVASQQRAAWAEVRRGTRVFADPELYYVTTNAERYRQLFGIDPQTLERIG